MKVSAMFLGIAHPLRAGPLCLDVPRMEAEINSIVEVEGSKVFSTSAAALAQIMPSFVAFVKGLAEEAGVSQKECKKVVVALNSVLAREVKAKGVYAIPGMMVVRTKRTPAKQAGPRKMFGKIVEAKAKPEGVRIKVLILKKLKEILK